jgi:hypothetical protein
MWMLPPLPPDEDGASRAWLEYPRALPDYQETIPLLLERLLAVLQKRGVDRVETRCTTMWPGSFEIIISETNRAWARSLPYSRVQLPTFEKPLPALI